MRQIFYFIHSLKVSWIPSCMNAYSRSFINTCLKYVCIFIKYNKILFIVNISKKVVGYCVDSK